jgi:hypothetical protein
VEEVREVLGSLGSVVYDPKVSHIVEDDVANEAEASAPHVET